MLSWFFPFSNGVGVFNGEKLCVCINDERGMKRVYGKNIKNKSRLMTILFFRGLVYFFYGIYLYVLSFSLGQNMSSYNTDNKEKNRRKSRLQLFLLLSFAFSGILAFVMSVTISRIIFSKILTDQNNFVINNLIVALFRIALIYLIFLVIKFIPVMYDIYSFNGAGCRFFNKNNKKEIIYARMFPLNFLNFLLNISILSTFVVSLIAVKISWVANFCINIAIYIACISICYEILYLQTCSKFVWMKDVALITNFLVLNKPRTTHNEVLSVIKNELENYNEFAGNDMDKIPLSSVYAEMETKLKANDRYEKSDVDWIIANVLNLNRIEVKLKRFLTEKEYRDVMKACERRAKGEPVSNIFGFVEFFGLRFDINKKVLSPRMETEILVEEVLKKIKEIKAENVLDLCTGSGAIAISIAKNSNCNVFASDISKQALSVAENNAKKNEVRVEFSQSDLFKALKKNRKYDIIVSNPPYIKSQDIEKLDIEVKDYDPKLALDGGEDGLDFYRTIIFESVEKLNNNGYLFFELGENQFEDARKLMENAGFKDIQIVKDYNNIERIIYGRISN